MSIELWKAAYQNAKKIHKDPTVTEQIPQMGSKKVKDTLINSVFYWLKGSITSIAPSEYDP